MRSIYIYICIMYASRFEPFCPTIICLHLNLNVPLPMKWNECQKWKRYQPMIMTNNIKKHGMSGNASFHMFCRHSWCLFVLCTYFQKFCGSGDNASMKHFCIVISFSFVPSHKCNMEQQKENVKREQQQKYEFLSKIPRKIWTCFNTNVSTHDWDSD